ncbi:MAG: metallophosphoesterase [Desulfobulbaceae bacterium]|nr:metallophosphoesterase [Desulfobulbaceae bacterium]
MRLAIPSLVLCIYIIVSLVAFAPCRPLVKVFAGLALLVISQKYLIYERIGGSFIAPDLPGPLLLGMEILYAFMVILVFLLVLKDGLALLLWLSRLLGSSWHLPFSPAIRSVGLVMAALVLGIYGTWQAIRVPDVRTVEITLPRLPASLDGFSIVQLSDIHIGSFLKGAWLRDVVAKTNALFPDLVAVTGDIIDGSPEELKDDVAPFADLQARYGVYGITGNHEYYFRVEEWLPVFAKLGITMLQNEQRILSGAGGAEIVIAGVPDQAGLHYGGVGPDIKTALAGAPDTVRILMTHRPNGIVCIAGKSNADLQLSGHTHGGHLLFMQWLISTFNGGLVGGLYEVDGMKLYVSPGTGIWSGFSCRLGVPAEITRIILRSPIKG